MMGIVFSLVITGPSEKTGHVNLKVIFTIMPYQVDTLCTVNVMHHVRRNGTEWKVCFSSGFMGFFVCMFLANVILFINKSASLCQA